MSFLNGFKITNIETESSLFFRDCLEKSLSISIKRGSDISGFVERLESIMLDDTMIRQYIFYSSSNFIEIYKSASGRCLSIISPERISTYAYLLSYFIDHYNDILYSSLMELNGPLFTSNQIYDVFKIVFIGYMYQKSRYGDTFNEVFEKFFKVVHSDLLIEEHKEQLSFLYLFADTYSFKFLEENGISPFDKTNEKFLKSFKNFEMVNIPFTLMMLGYIEEHYYQESEIIDYIMSYGGNIENRLFAYGTFYDSLNNNLGASFYAGGIDYFRNEIKMNGGVSSYILNLLDTRGVS